MRNCISALFLFCSWGILGQVNLTKSNLPIIIISTGGQQIQDEPKIKVDMGIIDNGPGIENMITDTPNNYSGKAGIELRGSTSQWFPKQPYGFETWDNTGADLDVSLLGMPKESDWTLNATYNDKSLMRDALSYILAGSIMEYAPRVRYNELVLNGQYQGVYLLVEKIKRDKHRVDIEKMETTDNTGDALTGGYIIKIDKETGTNSGQGWNSLYSPYSGAWQNTFFQYDYPKATDITTQQKSYIRQHMNAVENSIAGENFKDANLGYRKYIDTQSLMDYIIMNEITKNPDAYRLSTYFYKERDSDGGKIKFGPVWDFNLGFGNVDYCTQGNPEGLVITTFNKVCPGDGWVIHFWWNRFLEDESFYEALKLRWKNLRAEQFSNDRVNFVIDSLSTMLEQPQQRNFQRWPVLGQYVWPNYFVGSTYAEEKSFLKTWVNSRIAYLDRVWEIKDTSIISTEDDKIVILPNPAINTIRLYSNTSFPAILNIYIINSTGQIVEVPYQNIDKSTLELNLDPFSPGMYIVRISDGRDIQNLKFIKQ